MNVRTDRRVGQHRLVRSLLAGAVTALALVGPALPALAEERSATRNGMTLTVSKGSGLDPAGEKVRVRGSGYDRSKGIYVAFCVDNGPGRQPTPCGGGADTEGRSGNSVWISDLPPAYGTGLAQPYGEGGTFDVEISVRAQLNEDVDCRRVRCAVVTRADHTRSEDRSMDVLVPVEFGTPASAQRGASGEATPRQEAAGSSDPARRGAGARPDEGAAAQEPQGDASPDAAAAPSAAASPSSSPATDVPGEELGVQPDGTDEERSDATGVVTGTVDPLAAASDDDDRAALLVGAALLAALGGLVAGGYRVLTRRAAAAED
jgi:hypothetical protein